MSKCKNCNSELNGKYCSNCGQPAELKRIDANYIKHEIEHVLHFDKGIFYTIKELIIRPGKNVREFFTENRNRLVKPIIFIIVTSLIYTIINHYFHIEEQYVQQKGLENSTVGKMIKWVQEHYGYANIIMGIFVAFFVKLFFRKSNYNIYEIIILLCFIMGIGMLIYSVFAILQGLFHIDIFQIGGIIALIYTTFAIADFFDKTKVKNYFKSLTAYILGMIAFFVTIIIVGVTIDLITKYL